MKYNAVPNQKFVNVSLMNNDLQYYNFRSFLICKLIQKLLNFLGVTEYPFHNLLNLKFQLNCE